MVLNRRRICMMAVLVTSSLVLCVVFRLDIVVNHLPVIGSAIQIWRHDNVTKMTTSRYVTYDTAERFTVTETSTHRQSGDTEQRINTSTLGREGGFALISNLVLEGTLDFRRVAEYPVKDEYLTAMEREILSDKPVTDLTTVASLVTSQLQIVGPKQNGTVKVGDSLKVRVVLKDSRGRPVLTGGHKVRLWMVTKGATQRALAGDVTDLRNGTYLASLPVLWAGHIVVVAALQQPREFVRVVLSLMSTMKMMNQIIAAFVFRETEEVTLCSFIPVIPGYPEVCDLTSLNGGLPWYCGHPSTPGLQCRHWIWSSHTNFPLRYPVSPAENALFQQVVSQSGCVRKLKQKISITAVEDAQKLQVVKRRCRPLIPRDTWKDESARGYWKNDTWHPLTGCPLPQVTYELTVTCLRNTTVLFLGDSNARAVFETMGREMHCRKQQDPDSSEHPNMLHVPLHSHCPKQSVWLSWYPHSYPFFTGQGKWSDRRVKHPPSYTLDAVSSSGRFVIFIHVFLHFSQVHPHVYAQHIRDMARGVRDVIKRNPNVTVFIRGPHAVGGNMFCSTSDFHTQRCLRVLKSEFRDLRDHVVLLNTWYMTVANENCPIHPSRAVLTTLYQTMCSHLCPNHVNDN